jgi:hypothetical protein
MMTGKVNQKKHDIEINADEVRAVEALQRQGNFHEVRRRLRAALHLVQDTPLKRYAVKNAFRFEDDKGIWAIGLGSLAFVVVATLVASLLGV